MRRGRIMLTSCLLMAALGDGTRADELRLAQYYGPDYPPPGYGYPPPCQAVTRVLCGAPRVVRPEVRSSARSLAMPVAVPRSALEWAASARLPDVAPPAPLAPVTEARRSEGQLPISISARS